ncbi:alpha/beta hydrolase fold domain-containing protein [Kitasatospora sp. NPDC057692]|uniref:alpha/beta hydrolase fold domain-containing protein n=1 Tax=Kitasatospora sp. NPDC057692 TaxID=3346215 RepID=UPI0036774BF7
MLFHGGGFIVGDLDTHDGICRRLCRDLGAVVVSAGYRLALRAPLPRRLRDSLAGTEVCPWGPTAGRTPRCMRRAPRGSASPGAAAGVRRREGQGVNRGRSGWVVARRSRPREAAEKGTMRRGLMRRKAP